MHCGQRFERLCKYVARPPLATERLTRLDDGRLCYRLKRRWRDGTTQIVLEPVALLERLALSIPPPRFHLVRYYGILAPCASWRDHVVPGGRSPAVPENAGAAIAEREGGPAAGTRRVRRPGGDPLDEGHEMSAPPESWRPPSPEGDFSAVGHAQPQTKATLQVALSRAPGAHRPRRLSWGELLTRVFAVDAFACPQCGSRMRLLAAIESEETIRAILGCLGLPARAPPLAPAESEPTTGDLGFDERPPIEG
jgi:hypothetical protein